MISTGSKCRRWIRQHEVRRMSAGTHRPGRRPEPAIFASIRCACTAWLRAARCLRQSSTISSTTSSRPRWIAVMLAQSQRRRRSFGIARTTGSRFANLITTSRPGRRMARSGDLQGRLSRHFQKEIVHRGNVVKWQCRGGSKVQREIAKDRPCSIKFMEIENYPWGVSATDHAGETHGPKSKLQDWLTRCRRWSHHDRWGHELAAPASGRRPV